ncbi:tetratricopeptide repeat protein 23 isoform 4-T11 [Dama dama]
MQESQETHISNHLDEIVAAVSITPRKKLQNQLLQRALFQPPREKLRLSEDKAKSYASSHEYKKALHELVHCMALTRICYGDSHWKLAEAHVNLAKGYLQLKGMSLQAKQHAEKAKEILTSSIVPPYNDNTDVFKCSVELFHTLGQALLSLQKFKEASKNLTKAEILSKEMLQCGKIIKEEWMEIQARIKLSFAQVYQGQKKSKEALPHYQEALEYTEISRGEKSLECVPILRGLAAAEQALGFHDASVSNLVQMWLSSIFRIAWLISRMLKGWRKPNFFQFKMITAISYKSLDKMREPLQSLESPWRPKWPCLVISALRWQRHIGSWVWLTWHRGTRPGPTRN